MRLYTINTGFFKLDGGAMFGVVPKSIWSKIHPPDENNLCSWSMRCMLIEEGDRLILVDNGIGNKQDARFLGHYHLHGQDNLDKSLTKYGFHRDDVTDVLLTHLHFDHCGGSIIREGEHLVPAFRRAVYWSNERHWKWATQPNEREKASFLKENILPIQESGQLRFIGTGDDHPAGGAVEASGSIKALTQVPSGILPQLSLRIVNGHTDAMMLPQIRYKGRTIVFMADLLPSAGHIPIAYVMAYDMFPLTTLQEKRAFLKEASDGEYLLFFEHDPLIEGCALQMTEKGLRSGETLILQDL